MNNSSDHKPSQRNVAPNGDDIIWAGLTSAVLGFILLLRVISLYYNDTALFFDEAQYWLWGKEPAFGYFSKPPMLGWIIAVGTTLCGSDSEFCVRLPSPVFHTITAIFIFLGTARLFDRRTGFWAAFIFVTLPGISLSSTLISTDVALLTCWAASFWAVLRLKNEFTWFNAMLLGFAIGLGLMSKYAMAYFFLCGFLMAVFDSEWRKIIFSFKFIFVILVAITVLSPNLWWNYQHEFITASHTGDNIGWRGNELHLDKMAEFFGSQFGVFGPILFAIYLIALVRFLFEKTDHRHKLLVFFSLPVLALITFQALMSKAYANWAAVTYICATILVADILVNMIPKLWLRLSNIIHVLIFSGLSVAVAYSSPGILTLPDGREPFHRLQGWLEIAGKVELKLEGDAFGSVIGSQRHLTAELVYYLRHREEFVFAIPSEGSPHDHYELTRGFNKNSKVPVLYVSRTGDVAKVSKYFSDVKPLGESYISSGSIAKIWFYKLDGFDEGAGN